MKSCQDCIHYEVCHKRRFPTIYGIFDDGCEHFASESPFRRTIRFIYADLLEAAARYRHDAEIDSYRGRPSQALLKREYASFCERKASRVRYFCRKIGYDPANDKLEPKTEDQK